MVIAEAVFLAECIGLVLCIVTLSTILGYLLEKEIIPRLKKYWPGIKITSSEATSYFLQALLAVVIAYSIKKN